MVERRLRLAKALFVALLIVNVVHLIIFVVCLCFPPLFRWTFLLCLRCISVWALFKAFFRHLVTIVALVCLARFFVFWLNSTLWFCLQYCFRFYFEQPLLLFVSLFFYGLFFVLKLLLPSSLHSLVFSNGNWSHGNRWFLCKTLIGALLLCSTWTACTDPLASFLSITTYSILSYPSKNVLFPSHHVRTSRLVSVMTSLCFLLVRSRFSLVCFAALKIFFHTSLPLLYAPQVRRVVVRVIFENCIER